MKGGAADGHRGGPATSSPAGVTGTSPRTHGERLLQPDAHEAVGAVRDALLGEGRAKDAGVLLYFLYDKSAGQKKTRALVDAAVGQGMQLGAFAPMLAPVVSRLAPMLEDAGLLQVKEGR